MDTVAAMSGECRIGEVAEAAIERDIAVDIAAQVSNSGIAKVCRINALRKQRKGVKKIYVLRIGVQSQRGFDFAAANSEPALEAVVNNSPVQRGMVLSELAKIAVVQLCSDSEPIGDIRGHIDSEVSESAAASIAVHREPVVGICVDKPLRCESVDLHVAVKELEVLRL